jgi:hypothetical protein
MLADPPNERHARFDFVVQSGIGIRCNIEGQLSEHRFKVGQSVKYTYGIRGLRRQPPGSGGIYKVTQLLPAEGDERLYRVKSAEEPHERVAKETELERIT